MHVDACEVELNLKSYVNISSVNRWRPPKSKSPIRDLVQARPLSMSEFFVLHTFLEATRFFPKQPLPSGEVSPFEKCVLEDTLNSTQCLDHICAVIIEVPQFAIVLLMRPPEGVLLQDLILLEILAGAPSFIIRKS